MSEVKLGLKENRGQFVLLVIVNAFVGGMVGLERSILPEIASAEFAIAAKTAVLSFIVVFGLVKAITNYYAGAFANKVGRKRLLVIGWLMGIPVPLILMYAPNWNWIIVANIFLGINQGLAWSSTVVMKIDLVGEKKRGFAMGINEFAGYLSVGIVAFLTGWIAQEYGIRPYPFYLGLFLVAAGLFTSLLFIRDTRHHVAMETKSSSVPKLQHIFRDTTWRHHNLGSVTQAGLVNNLNDGMVWGIFPILLAIKGFSIEDIAIIVAVYPSVWGIGQLMTGALADHFPKKNLLVIGMAMQGVTLILISMYSSFQVLILLSAILGLGTATVYPTFLAAIADDTHPEDRAKSVGVFRLWRDLGYAFGAILTGIIADILSIETAIVAIGILTLFSALIILVRMKN